MLLNIRLKIKDFFRKNKYKILIAIIIWTLVLVVNAFIGKLQENELPSSTYEMHTPILESVVKVPSKLKTPIEELIDKYIGYCNAKDYENAYNMLDEACRNTVFLNIENFKIYIDKVFTTKKTYNIQNYSNIKDIYIYRVRIFDDIMATGLTGVDEMPYYEEKFTVKSTENGLTLSIRNFISEEALSSGYENDEMKINILEKAAKYDTEKYTLKIKNKTDYTIIISDFMVPDEILLKLEKETRKRSSQLLKPIIINPLEVHTIDLEFAKYFDESEKAESIMFNAIRIVKQYNGEDTVIEEGSENVIKLFSLKLAID